MKHTQRLQDYQLSFDAYLEFTTPEDFELERGCFNAFFDEYGHEFTELEDALYWTVDGLADVAEEYFKPIIEQERMDYERDLRNDLACECNH